MQSILNIPFEHRLRFVTGVFEPGCGALREFLSESRDESPARAILFFDDGLIGANPHLPQSARRYFDLLDRDVELVDTALVAGGERCKNDPAVLRDILQRIHDAGIDRKSYVIAAGGGAVLDAVGYAAAIAHRGVRLIRLPSTTLAQDDSGVGVKNGVNAFGKKNFLGAFAVPWAVINDLHLLRTLSDRDWVSGFSEAVKVALIRDATFFSRLCRDAPAIRRREERVAFDAIQRSAELHYRHIVHGGDPFETDQARPLDFGHWAAHKLESLSDYRLCHGEAVAIGVAIDTVYAQLVDMVDADLCRAVLDCLSVLGFELSHPLLDEAVTLMEGLEEFREHLGGQLTITLPRGVGRSVDVHRIDDALMRQAIGYVGQVEMSGRGVPEDGVIGKG